MPGPRRFAPLTRVGHESCPWPCGLPVWCNKPPDTKGNHHGTQQYRTLRRKPIRRTSSPGMSPTRATRVSGPASERRGSTATARAFPFNWKWSRSMAGSFCARRWTTRRRNRALSARPSGVHQRLLGATPEFMVGPVDREPHHLRIAIGHRADKRLKPLSPSVAEFCSIKAMLDHGQSVVDFL